MAWVLVVDDDAPFRQATIRLLQAAGHVVAQAADGREALRAIEAEPVDLVITDIMMPDGDGIELISAMNDRFPEVKVLAISGRGSLGALDLLGLAEGLGVSATLTKPFSPDQFLEKVSNLLLQGNRPPGGK